MSLDKSLFVSANVHERDVTLADGTVHPMHFREIPNSKFRRFQLLELSDDIEQRVRAPAELIAASLCEPDGSDAITLDEAATLKPGVARALVTVIGEVCGFTAKKASPSAEA